MNENAIGQSRGGRVRWSQYSDQERRILDSKLISDDAAKLDFLGDYWNVVHDEGDTTQYSRMASVWRLSKQGQSFKTIGNTFHLDQRKACALVSGLNCRPYLAQMYLNREKLGPPRREGWKWILDCTPKPTNPYPRALQVPERIRSHEDILEFLKQLPPVSEESEALRFFGLTSAWAEEHKAELFWFLLGFFVGDAGKYYAEYAPGIRHYRKTQLTTIMSLMNSNFRVLRYVQLALESLGIHSHQIHSDRAIIRWNSGSSNIITWIMQVCAGLKEGERTSTNELDMPWMRICPKNLIIAFLQGLADSDGHVNKQGYYAEIASVPNSTFYNQLFNVLDIDTHQYPQAQPRMVRILLKYAVHLPLFNPIIRSYRYQQLIQHAIRRKLVPPPSLFFS